MEILLIDIPLWLEGWLLNSLNFILRILLFFSAILGARKHEGPNRLFKDRMKAHLELFLFDLILLYVNIVI